MAASSQKTLQQELKVQRAIRHGGLGPAQSESVGLWAGTPRILSGGFWEWESKSELMWWQSVYKYSINPQPNNISGLGYGKLSPPGIEHQETELEVVKIRHLTGIQRWVQSIQPFFNQRLHTVSRHRRQWPSFWQFSESAVMKFTAQDNGEQVYTERC